MVLTKDREELEYVEDLLGALEVRIGLQENFSG